MCRRGEERTPTAGVAARGKGLNLYIYNGQCSWSGKGGGVENRRMMGGGCVGVGGYWVFGEGLLFHCPESPLLST